MQGPCDGLRDYRGGDGLRANSMLIMVRDPEFLAAFAQLSAVIVARSTDGW